MPYITTMEEWQRQSTLLLQARPTTTRITTKYHIPNLTSPRHEKKLAKRSQKSKDAAAAAASTSPDAAAGTTVAAAAAPKAARAYLELKTFDPESGTVLKYKTDKGAEVGRLIGGLGRLGRPMAGLEVREEDVEMKDTTAPAADVSGTATPQAEVGAPIGEASAVQQKAQQNAPSAGGGGGNKNKKKKGKK